MISFASKQDNILPLFERCFPGADEFNKYFFSKIYQAENALVYKKEGKIVAMLQMLPFETNIGKSMYLFGVCTDENYRRQGLSAQLMEKSFEVAKERACSTVILIPEHAWLYDFYAKFGFKKNLKCDKGEIVTNHANHIKINQLTYNDIECLIKLYNENIGTGFYVLRDYEFYKWQIDLYGDGAVKYMENDRIIGYSFGYKKDDTIVLDEIISHDYDLCFNAYDFANVSYKKPNGNDNLGMIKYLSGNQTNNGYINLMFN